MKFTYYERIVPPSLRKKMSYEMLSDDLDEFFEKMKKRRDNIINHAAREAIRKIIKNRANMTDKEIYQHTLNNRLDAIRESMERKNAEYASDDSPYHNFDAAAEMTGTTPEQALWGMMIKHLVSVRDMVEGGKITPYLINEKIGDVQNYMILLEGVLTRKLRDGEANDI